MKWKMIFTFLLFFMLFLTPLTRAQVPDPGHPASEIGPGTFYSGNFTFPNWLFITQGLQVNDTLLYIDPSTSRIGIGTSQPEASLHVTGSVLLENNQMIQWKNTTGGIVDVMRLQVDNQFRIHPPRTVIISSGTSGDSIIFLINDIEKMRINYNGNIGIGTTSPNAKLEISGIPPSGLSLNASGILYVNASSGNVGIGTTSPGAKLEIGSGQIAVPTGSVTAPSYAFSGDLNTGIYSSQANAVSVASGGTQALLIGGAALRIGPAGSAGTPSLALISDTNTGLYWPAADNLGIVTAGAEQVRIDSSGNVGIGTTGPSYMLDVAGTGRISNAGTSFVIDSNGDVWVRL